MSSSSISSESTPNKQAQYNRQELGNIDKMMNEMESFQQRANNYLTLRKKD